MEIPRVALAQDMKMKSRSQSLVQLDIVGWEESSCTIVFTEPPVIIGEFLRPG
jgi:hypothetical protein